jgi:hypothetical protein
MKKSASTGHLSPNRASGQLSPSRQSSPSRATGLSSPASGQQSPTANKNSSTSSSSGTASVSNAEPLGVREAMAEFNAATQRRTDVVSRLEQLGGLPTAAVTNAQESWQPAAQGLHWDFILKEMVCALLLVAFKWR